MIRKLLFLTLLFAPLASWGLYKPVRVLAPELSGDVTCISEKLCLDNPSRHPEATLLYQQAIAFVNGQVGVIEKPPRAIFCTTAECYRAFGFEDSAASTVGTAGIVVSPRGWQPHYLRHELIHHLQAERLGLINYLASPQWFREGMAYALSEDPRQSLDGPWQQQREQFVTWYQGLADKKDVWKAARSLP